MESLSISSLHKAYREKKTTPIEVVEKLCSSIESDQSNAFLTLCKERALEQAKKSMEILKTESEFERKYPLLGIPLGIKDLFTIQGVKTTAASRILENYIPPYTATCVSRLEKAGAISIGKTNMDEFAMGSSNENSAFGSVKHPTHPEYVSGGSSGGSAAAVRASLCSGALGTDTGGSIRLPSHYCGVVGLKPTYGRVSRYGQIAFASSLDQCGPMTTTVRDAASLLSVMAGADPRDATSLQQKTKPWVEEIDSGVWSWKGKKVGIPEEYFGEGITEPVEKAVRRQMDWVKDQGAKMIPVSLPHTPYAVPTYYMVAVSEASSNLARYDGVRFGVRPPEIDQVKTLKDFYEEVRSLFGEEVKRRILLGTFALSSGYYDAYYQRACKVRRLIQNDFLKAFEHVDLLISPVSPGVAFRQGEKVAKPLSLYLVDVLTTPASLAGLPAMSLPIGQDQNGLPIGMQLIAPHLEESRLFQASHSIETAIKGARQ